MDQNDIVRIDISIILLNVDKKYSHVIFTARSGKHVGKEGAEY